MAAAAAAACGLAGLRRALGLRVLRGLRGGWRPGGGAGPGRAVSSSSSSSSSSVAGAERRLRRRWGEAGAAAARGPPEAEEEEEEAFVFPELQPEQDEEEAAVEELLAEEAAAGGRRPARQRRRRPHVAPGGADPSVPASGVGCAGCGAELHCRDAALPGFVPSAKLLEGAEGAEGDGEALLCQRCWLLTHHRQALRVRMGPLEYRRVVSEALRGSLRHGRPPLALCLADVLALPDALPPGLPELLGPRAHVLVLGNKVDLLPADAPGHLKRLRLRLLEACARAGLRPHPDGGGPGQRVVDVHLLSAKTGYGVEELVSKMQRSWKFSGDVFLVGAANTGKSTLFNALLQSDYCKSRASDLIHRATISPWPGTTLNLLKFPIINPTPYRIFRREERLATDAAKTEEDLSEDEQKHLKTLKKQSYLIGRVGRTFQLPQKLRKNYEIDFDAEALSFSGEEEPAFQSKPTKKAELSYNEVKDARWFHDTPGIIRDGCVLNLLNEKEVNLVLPTCAIVPRTFLLKPGMTLFLAALGRIDYMQGDRPAWFTVVASNLLPVHITMVEKADDIYQKHAGHKLLKVPLGGEERMKDFPPLVPQDVTLEGTGEAEAVADINLSSAGWVAVTAHSDNRMHLRCYTPEGTALTVRKPPLLPHIVQIKGERVRKSPAYKTKRPPPLVENLGTKMLKNGTKLPSKQ